jgi:hypothetical protein
MSPCRATHENKQQDYSQDHYADPVPKVFFHCGFQLESACHISEVSRQSVTHLKRAAQSFMRNEASKGVRFHGEALPHNAHEKAQEKSTSGLRQRILAVLGSAPVSFSEPDLPMPRRPGDGKE